LSTSIPSSLRTISRISMIFGSSSTTRILFTKSQFTFLLSSSLGMVKAKVAPSSSPADSADKLPP
jgi:hypothetical protein